MKVIEEKNKEKNNMTDKTDNLALWNSVCVSSPETLKAVNYGQRKFTAIGAQSQRKRATELWGAYGANWGLRKLVWSTIAKNGELPVELILDCEFFWPGGSFEFSSDIKYKPGEDCRKKLHTDVLTKSLSELGFNSDVFEGKWEDFADNKYVADTKQPPQPKPPPPRKKKERTPATTLIAIPKFSSLLACSDCATWIDQNWGADEKICAPLYEALKSRIQEIRPFSDENAADFDTAQQEAMIEVNAFLKAYELQRDRDTAFV